MHLRIHYTCTYHRQKHLYHNYIQILILTPSIAPGCPGLLKCPSWAPAAATRTATAPPATPAALAPPLPRGAGRPWRHAAARGLGDPPGAARRNDLGKQGWYFLNKQTHTCIIYIYIILYIYILYYLVISCFTVNLGWLKIKSGQIGGGLSTLAC